MNLFRRSLSWVVFILFLLLPAAGNTGEQGPREKRYQFESSQQNFHRNVYPLPPHHLDPRFGEGGIVITQIGQYNPITQTGQTTSVINDIVLQPDQKIVAAGSSYFRAEGISINYPSHYYAVARYLPDGSLDRSFGDPGPVIRVGRNGNSPYDAISPVRKGFTTTHFEAVGNFGRGANDQAFAVSLQSDGKIVAGGFSDTLPTRAFSMARYAGEGSMDLSFGEMGRVVTLVSSFESRAYDIVIRDDDRILAAGKAWVGAIDGQVAICGYRRTGLLDPLFGNGGIALPAVGCSDSSANSMAIQSDGKIIAVGTCDQGRDLSHNFIVIRLAPDGHLDEGFGNGGFVTMDIGKRKKFDSASSVAIQQNGKIVVGGRSCSNAGDCELVLARYNSNGTLDAEFGNEGIVLAKFAPGLESGANAIAIQTDGKILAAGSAGEFLNDASYDFALARFLPNGTPDVSFGNEGVILTDVSGGHGDNVHAIVLQPDGKIIVAGMANGDFALVRYMGN